MPACLASTSSRSASTSLKASGTRRLGQQRAERLVAVEDGHRHGRRQTQLGGVAVGARSMHEPVVVEVVAGDERPPLRDGLAGDALVDADGLIGRPRVVALLGGRVPRPADRRRPGVVEHVDVHPLGVAAGGRPLAAMRCRMVSGSRTALSSVVISRSARSTSACRARSVAGAVELLDEPGVGDGQRGLVGEDDRAARPRRGP